MKKNIKVFDIVSIAIVAALYIVLTVAPGFNAISYGPVQFRFSEMFNFLAFYNKKYIIAVTLGCMISNFMSFTIVDVIVGGLSTLIFVWLGIILFDHFKGQYFLNGQLNKAFVFFAIFFAFTMFTIAIELVFVAGAPFIWTWFTLFLGEFASLIVGGIIIDKLSKRIDLSK
ncbi:MAG TPA: QueT transporter family protein [Lactovum miscens]|uniref:QueT transporter family protein n=1 Tax=Lactovum miscens TaxID=190387 RepID=UPI002ED9740C